MKKKDLIKNLTAVIRFLLCYQIYFKQMVNRGWLLNILHCLSNELIFSKRVYQIEHNLITQFFPNLIPDLVKIYFCMDYQTG